MDFKIIFVLCLSFAATLASPLNEEVKADLRCPHYGYGCDGEVLMDSYVNDWEICALNCLEERSCVYWHWDTLDHPDFPGRCYLMGSCTVKQGYQWISGNYDCYNNHCTH
ncbi:uncharacterized protein LOC111709646 isoform X2 [Eurytemora carolleeae]|uniref:uncharacterized protein LOC111709646 isoform X2 n=1 Tax=Eurytemora carolleeae TaxID=1294199 RepID=UPI000C76FADF|nr:uncharacterized protein LOC111709646 isoform X2 [Eurytemora carolleeae]|eukprot:XP_023339185.1 uncharacterized protein LOC111709646 isoform X2 [Eurytemora affinis]